MKKIVCFTSGRSIESTRLGKRTVPLSGVVVLFHIQIHKFLIIRVNYDGQIDVNVTLIAAK